MLEWNGGDTDVVSSPSDRIKEIRSHFTLSLYSASHLPPSPRIYLRHFTPSNMLVFKCVLYEWVWAGEGVDCFQSACNCNPDNNLAPKYCRPSVHANHFRERKVHNNTNQWMQWGKCIQIFAKLTHRFLEWMHNNICVIRFLNYTSLNNRTSPHNELNKACLDM